MCGIKIFPMGDGSAVRFAVRELEHWGIAIAPELTEEVSHVLLDVPTKNTDFSKIPPKTVIIGGNLDGIPADYSKVDLLRDAQYVSENAALTADCALRLLGQHLPVAFQDCPILVIGWGRIGKCLALLLKHMGAKVSVAARKPSDLGMLTALGYNAVEIGMVDANCYRAILNTAPAPVLGTGGNCIKIDLASQLGMAGDDVIWARGLPGKMLPESSGALIARAVLRYLKEGVK